MDDILKLVEEYIKEKIGYNMRDRTLLTKNTSGLSRPYSTDGLFLARKRISLRLSSLRYWGRNWVCLLIAVHLLTS